MIVFYKRLRSLLRKMTVAFIQQAKNFYMIFEMFRRKNNEAKQFEGLFCVIVLLLYSITMIIIFKLID